MKFLSFASALIAFAALGLLGVVTIADLFDGPGTERSERVAMTPETPETPADLPDFLAKARYYVGQRYALKDRFIAWNGLAKMTVFGHSPATDVALGSDGFLFLKEEGAVSIVQGRKLLSADQQAEWAQAFNTVKNAFANEGILYGLLIGPNKHSIYPDLLPHWIDAVPLNQTRTANIYGAAKGAFGETYPDPRLDLSEERSRQPEVDLYHPADTHWTEWGAALAVHAQLQFMGIDLQPPTYEIMPLPRNGDLSRMTGQQNRTLASAPTLPKTWSCVDEGGATLDVVTIDPLMPTQFTCGSPLGRPEKVVVFNDSFGVSAIPYLAARFQTVDFIWTDQADPVTAKERGAKIVLQIFVERKLATDTPSQFWDFGTVQP